MRLREVRVRQGDDLRAIALRELRDPSRWSELAQINGLQMPFVVASIRPEDRLARTVIWGDVLRVPSIVADASRFSAADGFGADVQLSDGALMAGADGDLALAVGQDNLFQALSLRVRTLRGELTYHHKYGSHVQLALGLPAGPVASLMAATFVFEALSEDPRLASVDAVDAAVDADATRISARVSAVGDNTPTDFNLVLKS